MTVSITALERSRDWLESLSVDATGADRPLLNSVDVEMLEMLAGKEGALDSHVDTLLDAADELGLSDDYVAEVNDAAETVRTALASIGTEEPEPLSTEEKKQLDAATSTLRDCANGLLEDIGAERGA